MRAGTVNLLRVFEKRKFLRVHENYVPRKYELEECTYVCVYVKYETIDAFSVYLNNHFCNAHCGNYGDLPSRFFGKNFVKPTHLLKS